MTPTPDNAPVKPSALPLVALILGIVGFCFPPLFLVAIILAIVSLAKGSEPAFAARKVLAIITLALGVIYVPMVGILAAIAIPNFIKFQARSKQSECKALLKSAWAAQQSYLSEQGHFGATAEEIGFTVEPGNRYLYWIGQDSVVPATHAMAPPSAELQQAIPAAIRQSIGLHGDVLTMACAGNVDTDNTIDVWVVTSDEGAGSGPGQPFNVQDDLRE